MFNQFNPRSVTFNIIFLNILFFLVTDVIGGRNPELKQLADNYCALHYPASPLFMPLQLVTYMFMHEGFMHIFGNMFGLFMFGAILERVWGPQRFFIFYFVTGLGAAFTYIAVQAFVVYRISGSVHPPLEIVNQSMQLAEIYLVPTLGASGAIFGILIAFAMLFPNMELMFLFFPVPIKAKYLVTGYVIYEIWGAQANNPNDHVAHFAHLGGALFGFILVKIWNRNRNSLY
jgi:membrane associated rhomboid family serine protease